MIAVLGAGSWGSALASVLARNKQEVILWGRNTNVLNHIAQHQENHIFLPGIQLSNIEVSDDLQYVIAQTEYILLTVPSQAVPDLLDKVLSYQNHLKCIIWASKGLDKSGRMLHSMVEEKTNLPYAIISGPSFAKEVALDQPTAVVIACKDESLGFILQRIFHRTNFRIYLSDDVIGIQVGGIVKNIVAVATGIADGLQLGANARAALITRGLAEMMRLGKRLGAKSETLIGLAGLGDLVLSCTDNQSRNRYLGLGLGQGKNIDAVKQEIGQVTEAYVNAQILFHKAKEWDIELPITEQIKDIFAGRLTVHEAVNNLLSRKPSEEH